MTFINKTLFIFILMIFSVLSLSAQDEVEYKMELGGMIGGSFYLGDANYTSLFKNTGFAGGVVARYILNPRMALKGNLAAGKISGTTKDFDNKFPQDQQFSFNRTIIDLGIQFEYNFFAYGSGKGYRGNKRLTPYILGGIGTTLAPAPAEVVFTLNLPIGGGIKYKLANRLNIGCEFTMRFSFSDKLDVTNKSGLQLNDPYGIKGSGLKNKDSYSFTTVFVTYDLFPKLKNCNNL